MAKIKTGSTATLLAAGLATSSFALGVTEAGAVTLKERAASLPSSGFAPGESGPLKVSSGDQTKITGHPEADIKFSELKYTDAKHSDLKHADLKHSDLKHSDMKHSDLKHSDLKHADFKQSDLKRSDPKAATAIQADQKI